MVIIMKEIKKNAVISAAMTAVTVLFIALIFIHSSMTADESDGESLAALDLISDIFRRFGISLELTKHIIRKTAHFCEFALLGVLSTVTVYSYIKKPLNNMTTVCFICLATATADEAIQLFVPGRAGMVQDIVLDFSGALTGTLIATAILLVIISVRKKKSR